MWLSSSHHFGVLPQRALQPSLLEIPTYSIFFSSLISRNSTFGSGSSSSQQRFFARLARPMSRKLPVRNEGPPSNIRGVDSQSTKPKFYREPVTLDRNNLSEVPRKRRDSSPSNSFSGREGRERTNEEGRKPSQREVSASSKKRRDYSPSKSFSGREENKGGMERKREQRGRERGPDTNYGSSSSSIRKRDEKNTEREARETAPSSTSSSSSSASSFKKGGGSYREREKRRKEKGGRREREEEESALPPTPPLKKISEEKESTLKNGYKLRIITEDEAGMRLDHFMTQYYQLPNSLIHRLLREKKIFTGIETREKQIGSHRLAPNEHVHFWGHIANLPKLGTSERKPKSQEMKVKDQHIEDIRASILFQDEYFLAINKPSGVSVQGGSKVKFHVAGLLPYLQFDAEEPPRLVHRLDQETSGVLFLARTQKAAKEFTQLMKRRQVMKIYWATVVGTPSSPSGRVDSPLFTRKFKDGERITTKEPESQQNEQQNEDGEGPENKRAITEFQTIASCSNSATFLELVPLTGRKHQLRVHCAEVLETPILGDKKYGEGIPDSFKELVQGRHLHLHARGLSFSHPFKPSEKVRVIAPLPSDLKTTWETLGFPLTTPRTTLDPSSSSSSSKPKPNKK